MVREGEGGDGVEGEMGGGGRGVSIDTARYPSLNGLTSVDGYR